MALNIYLYRAQYLSTKFLHHVNYLYHVRDYLITLNRNLSVVKAKGLLSTPKMAAVVSLVRKKVYITKKINKFWHRRFPWRLVQNLMEINILSKAGDFLNIYMTRFFLKKIRTTLIGKNLRTI